MLRIPLNRFHFSGKRFQFLPIPLPLLSPAHRCVNHAGNRVQSVMSVNMSGKNH
jgi:hypothetical protein